MIALPYSLKGFAEALKPAYDAMPIPALILPNAIAPALARKLRARLQGKLERFDFPTRGAYRQHQAHRDAELEAQLRLFAQAVSGERVERGEARWLLFGRGDYSLRLDDARTRCTPDRFLEVTLDFSTRPCPDARIVYTAGERSVTVPHAPGILSVVQRTALVSRYQSYLTQKMGRAQVYRLRLQLPTLAE